LPGLKAWAMLERRKHTSYNTPKEYCQSAGAYFEFPHSFFGPRLKGSPKRTNEVLSGAVHI